MRLLLLISAVTCLLSACSTQQRREYDLLPEFQQLQDTSLMIKARTFRISHFALADSNHVLAITQDESPILSDTSDFFEKFEIVDFNQDGFPDVRINNMGHIDSQSLYLYHPQSELYAKVRGFESYPQTRPLQTVFGRFYYSYEPDSCAGNYWTSDLFHLEYHYVTLIGRMSGNHCEEPYDIKLYRLHGEAQELRETFPYSGEQDSDKWKFIDRSWHDHYKRVFPDTLTVNQFVKFFDHPTAKDYDVTRYESKFWTYMTDKEKFWRNKKLLVGDTLKPLPVWGYPLSYTALNDTIKRVTLFDETNSGYQIAVYTLEKYYNVIASESLTRAEGDQGDQYKSVGHFRDDTTYVKTEVITVLDSVGSPSKHYLIFHANGSIERKDP